MKDFPYDLIGFDLDGTLVDSSYDLAAAVNHVLAGIGRPPLTVEQVRGNIGGGGRRMLARSLADAGVVDDPTRLDQRYTAMLNYYAEHIADTTRLYPGVDDVLEQLATSGVELALVTNKVESLAMKLLGVLGIRERFAAVIGGDSVAKGKPAPDPLIEMMRRCGSRRAAFVGDSEFDVAAAHAAGLPCIAVSFGFPGKPVAELGADAVIDNFAALPEALRSVAGQAER